MRLPRADVQILLRALSCAIAGDSRTAGPASFYSLRFWQDWMAGLDAVVVFVGSDEHFDHGWCSLVERARSFMAERAALQDSAAFN